MGVRLLFPAVFSTLQHELAEVVLARRLCLRLGDRGALTLYNATPEEHRHLAEQICAERPVMVSANGRAVLEWGLLPGGVENHLLDVLVGCCVAASERGCKLPGEIVPVKPRGKTLRELQAGQPKFVPPWRR